MTAPRSPEVPRHPPLSQHLRHLLQEDSPDGSHSLNALLSQTEGRGIYLVMILVSLPSIVPIPLPGLSFIIGAVTAWLGIRLAMDLPPRLPRFLGERSLPTATWNRILEASCRFLRFVEKLAKPRGRAWITMRPAKIGNALILVYLGLLLIVPFPPFILFTNSLPSYAVILVAASMMEEDGLLIWFGYAATVVATAYFALLFFGGFTLYERYSEPVIQYLRQLVS